MAWQENSMGAAWERHAMCESAFNRHSFILDRVYVLETYVKYRANEYLLH